MPIGPSTHAIGTHAIYSLLQQYLNCVVVSILAFHARDPGSIPPWSNNLSYFIFFPSHRPGVTKPSSSFRCSEGRVISHIKGVPSKLTYYCRSLHFTSARAQMLSYRDYKRDYKEFINGNKVLGYFGGIRRCSRPTRPTNSQWHGYLSYGY